MRRHVFTLLPPVGDQETVEEGSVIDLLGRIPYLLSSHILPPLHVLNELLQIGHSDAGMSGGCRWNPFTLSQEEFRELVSVLAQREGEDFVEFVSPPKWVTSFGKWHCWILEYCYGIPAKRQLEFNRELDDLKAEREEAQKIGDFQQVEQLLCRISDVTMEMSDFMNEHRKSHIWEREPRPGSS